MDVGSGRDRDTSRRGGSIDDEDAGPGKENVDGTCMDEEIEANASRIDWGPRQRSTRPSGSTQRGRSALASWPAAAAKAPVFAGDSRPDARLGSRWRTSWCLRHLPLIGVAAARPDQPLPAPGGVQDPCPAASPGRLRRMRSIKVPQLQQEIAFTGAVYVLAAAGLMTGDSVSGEQQSN